MKLSNQGASGNQSTGIFNWLKGLVGQAPELKSDNLTSVPEERSLKEREGSQVPVNAKEALELLEMKKSKPRTERQKLVEKVLSRVPLEIEGAAKVRVFPVEGATSVVFFIRDLHAPDSGTVKKIYELQNTDNRILRKMTRTLSKLSPIANNQAEGVEKNRADKKAILKQIHNLVMNIDSELTIGLHLEGITEGFIDKRFPQYAKEVEEKRKELAVIEKETKELEDEYSKASLRDPATFKIAYKLEKLRVDRAEARHEFEKLLDKFGYVDIFGSDNFQMKAGETDPRKHEVYEKYRKMLVDKGLLHKDRDFHFSEAAQLIYKHFGLKELGKFANDLLFKPREYGHLSQIEDPVAVSVFGMWHNFAKTVLEDWNLKHPDNKIAVVEITPNTIEKLSGQLYYKGMGLLFNRLLGIEVNS